MMLLALAVAYSGFTAVCLAMGRHHCQVWGHPPARRIATALRVVGFTLLAAALPIATVGMPGSVGVVVWFGALTLAAIALVALLPLAPRAVAWTAVAAPAAALLAVFVWP